MKVVYPFIFNSLSLYVSVCIVHMTADTLGGQKVLAPLGLELQVLPNMCAGNRLPVLCKSTDFLTAEPPHQPLCESLK